MNKDVWYLYLDAEQQWRWRRVAANGEIVGASTEGYNNRVECVENAMHMGATETDEMVVKEDPARVRRVVLTSGKLYYDLAKAREDRRQGDVALVRLVQLYPFPAEELESELRRYSVTAELVWAQEEPRNMGAFRFVREQFLDGCVPAAGLRALLYVGRLPGAAPAPGSYKVHQAEQDQILSEALG